MPDPLIVSGHIHSPVFIFLRAAGRFTDPDVLQLLDLKGFHPAAVQEDWRCPHLYITEDASWIHVASDWYYSLGTRGGLERALNLSRKASDSPVFMCFMGESDDSFGFSYAADDRLIRRFMVVDQHSDRTRRAVVEDSGIPMRGERPLAEVDQEYDYVFSLAEALGITVTHDPAAVRCYKAPPKRPMHWRFSRWLRRRA